LEKLFRKNDQSSVIRIEGLEIVPRVFSPMRGQGPRAEGV
jgi:hypothetical protein